VRGHARSGHDAHDAIPQLPLGHAGAELLHLARELEARHVGGHTRGRGVEAAALERVGAVEPRRRDGHADLAGAGISDDDVADLEDLGAAMLTDPDCTCVDAHGAYA
jgi:hypothetical protein